MRYSKKEKGSDETSVHRIVSGINRQRINKKTIYVDGVTLAFQAFEQTSMYVHITALHGPFTAGTAPNC